MEHFDRHRQRLLVNQFGNIEINERNSERKQKYQLSGGKWREDKKLWDNKNYFLHRKGSI